MKNSLFRFQLKTALSAFLLVVVSHSAAELRSERWRWSNPVPHGNNILDMYASADTSVQVGDSGTLYVERSGRWAPAVTGTDHYLRSTTLMGTRYIATGENGTILWSDDGRTFQPALLSSPTTDWLEGVAATPQKAVAVGDNGSIYTSSDGKNWTEASPAASQEWLRGVAFGNGAFVAVGENGTILRSSDLSSWLVVDSGTSEHLNRVRYLGSSGTSTFYAVGNKGTVLTSSTGDVWAPIDAGTTNTLNDAAYNSSGILLAGDGELRLKKTDSSEWINQVTALSSNAPPDWMYISAQSRMNTWLVAGRTGMLIEGAASTNTTELIWRQSPSYSPRAWLWDVTMQNGIYIAVGDLANIQSSLDGILWTREVVPESYTNVIWLGAGGNSNCVLAVGSEGNVLMSKSELTEISITNTVDGTAIVTNSFVNTLGVVWESVISFTDQTLQGVDASETLFITTGAGGSVFTSPDGTNWTTQITPTTNFLSSIAIGPNSCIAAGANGTLLLGNRSGTSWSAVTTDTTDWIYRVRWCEGTYIAVGENGRILTSPDGIEWIPRNSGTDRWLTDITFVDGRWYITGYQGTLISSPDLISWTSHDVPTGKSLYGAATENGQLITAGVEGVILRNQVIPYTDPVEILGYNQHTLISAGETNVLELFLFGGQPDQIFDFQYSTNLTTGWETAEPIELYDRSGTLYLIQTRPATNMPPCEFSRAKLIP